MKLSKYNIQSLVNNIDWKTFNQNHPKLSRTLHRRFLQKRDHFRISKKHFFPPRRILAIQFSNPGSRRIQSAEKVTATDAATFESHNFREIGNDPQSESGQRVLRPGRVLQACGGLQGGQFSLWGEGVVGGGL